MKEAPKPRRLACLDSGGHSATDFINDNHVPAAAAPALTDHVDCTHSLLIMADVATHQFSQIPFHRPATHASSTVGFGFGLSSAQSSSAYSLNTHAPLAPWNIPTAHIQPYNARPSKRRLEHDDDDTRSRPSSDDGMDRSPTPERPKRTAPKRARTDTAIMSTSKGGKNGKEGKESSSEDSDVDVGVLLGQCLFIFYFTPN